MVALTWLAGLVRRRPGRLLGISAGIALAVALLGSLGAFLTGAKTTMTDRAIAQVVVDWQVETQPRRSAAEVLDATTHDKRVQVALPITLGTTTGFQSNIGGTVQTTGEGVVVGLPPAYAATFPGSLRTLAGRSSGVLLAQQTAANLHAQPGAVIRIGREEMDSVPVRIDGVVEMPQADSFFQDVGAGPGSQPLAPPDNVLLLPDDLWRAVFAPLAQARPDLVKSQVHARLVHRLPHDPAAAYNVATRQAKNLELRLAGAALVGDNLGAALSAARSDAAYAQILFLLLGLPGAVLAGLLTRSVAAAGSERRRREQALLRARGASVSTLTRVAAAEAVAVTAVGGVVGLLAAGVVGNESFHSATFGTTPLTAVLWSVGAMFVGLLIALASVLLPAWRTAREATVFFARAHGETRAQPVALRLNLDLWLLAIAGVMFWQTSRSGYQLVLAPEGVPTVSVSYIALIAPLLFWIGAALLSWRLAELFLSRGGAVLRGILRPTARRLTAPVSATLRRQRRALATGIMLLGLTIAFALSTAVFNSTYRQQADADALLSNGADVAVTNPPGSPVPADRERRLAGVAGVRRVEPLQHRFAYVGADLQDLYGINPATIVTTTRLQDPYFIGGTAQALMTELQKAPDAALFSAETVKDFQLSKGDNVRVRFPDSRSGTTKEVTFRYVGIAKKFPTAPRDSFIVANASFVAAQTGDARPDVFLLDTTGSKPRDVAARVRTLVGASSIVTDRETSRRQIGSSLTAVDLRGLTRVELAYALVLAAAAAGLVFALGLAERRRSFAITVALGARPRQVGAFVWSEAVVLAGAALIVGLATGFGLSQVLVKVLTGVFDPPPSRLAIPWSYLLVLLGLIVVAITSAAGGIVRTVRRPALSILRDL